MRASAVEPHIKVEVEVKLVPLTVRVNAAPSARAVAGLRAVMVGAGGLTTRFTPGDRPPIVLTVMLDVPTPASRLAGTTAASCVELMYIVVSAFPFHMAAEATVKFDPLMVSVKAAPPATAMDGLRLSRAGGGGRRSVKSKAEEFPLRSLMEMLAVLTLALKAAGTTAVSCVSLTQFVASAIVPHITMEDAVKFAPLMVSMKSLPPANAEMGSNEVIDGGGPTESEKLGDDEEELVVFVESEEELAELEAGSEFSPDGGIVPAGIEVDAALLAALEAGGRTGGKDEEGGVASAILGAWFFF